MLHKKIGAKKFFAELVKLDPISKNFVKPTDTQRVIRAYEVKLFTKSCAIEFADLDYNIRVNSIHPGVIETKMGAQVVSNVSENLELGNNEAKEMTALMHPVKRMGVPEEIAQLALFLASNRSSFITGAEMVIDGGFTAK